MARRTLLLDDMDGSEQGVETYYFYNPTDGKFYEIDLSEKNGKTLTNTISKYAAKGREVSRLVFNANAVIHDKTSGKSSSDSDAAVVREWAKNEGMQVPERGRIPEEIREAYNKVHSPADKK